jgi:Ca2+/H+ antiporter
LTTPAGHFGPTRAGTARFYRGLSASAEKSRLKPSLDWLLVLVPVAFALRYVPAWNNQPALFIVSALAIIPIAGWMGHATEQLAHRMGEGIGGWLNASFGNAAGHSTAITMALKNKMDLSLGIAAGSSLQIALFVAPVLVFASYLFPQQLNLEFTLPEIAAIMLAAFVTDQIAGDGESNWLEGVQLPALYAIIGWLFYFLPAVH